MVTGGLATFESARFRTLPAADIVDVRASGVERTSRRRCRRDFAD
jgi:hypothetical protein